MAEQPADLSTPDFSEGISATDIPKEGSLYGRVGKVPVILSCFEGLHYAVGGACTHYGAQLKDGLQQRDRVRCPLHHACFDLRTGEAVSAPAFKPLGRWKVEQEGTRIFVREEASSAARLPRSSPAIERIVIVGGGAAGYACADRLRKLGYDGGLVIVSADEDAPYDRPNLTKDYLAGTAPEEWMPLAGGDDYERNRIELRLSTEAVGIDAERRTVALADGDILPYDRLLIATGSTPLRLPGPAFSRPNAHVLRSLSDARRILAGIDGARRAVLLGAGFIGLEAAAALRRRGLEVDIVSDDDLPFHRLLGRDVALFLKDLHEQNGVRFHLGETAADFDGRRLDLASGGGIDADLLLLGVGVRPNVALAQRAGLAVDDGIVVDAQLRTSAPAIFAAGDVASYPELGTGRRLRVEHWVTAQQQGETVAFNMLGEERRFDRVPFFWSEQYGVALRYVGYGARWTEVSIDGVVGEGHFTARYFEDSRMRASLSVGRDRDNLDDELRLETIAETSLEQAEAAPVA